MQGKWAKYAVRAVLMLFAAAFAVHVAEIVFGFFLISKAIYERGVLTSAAKNDRGDEVRFVADTNMSPYDTTISLRREGHWFSTTLLEARSNDLSVGVKWRGNDRLELQVDFGPRGKMGPPVRQVGPIHILYHFGGPDAVPAPDIRPYVSCPGPYDGNGGFWKNCSDSYRPHQKGTTTPAARGEAR